MGRKIVGIDPGKKGAIAVLDVDTYLVTIDPMPYYTIKKSTKTKDDVDPYGIGRLLDDPEIFKGYVEDVSSRPGEGVVSAFTFGNSYGKVLGAFGALNIPLDVVRPAVWKTKLRVPADKDAARYRASQLFPKLSHRWTQANQDGLAEALLIAFYGFCELGFILSNVFREEEK